MRVKRVPAAYSIAIFQSFIPDLKVTLKYLLDLKSLQLSPSLSYLEQKERTNLRYMLKQRRFLKLSIHRLTNYMSA